MQPRWRSAVLERRRRPDSPREPQAPAAPHAHAATLPEQVVAERISSRRSAGIGTGRRERRAAAPRPRARRASAASWRADVPLAAARPGDGARERRRERDDPVRRPRGDRGRRDAVDAPAREGHARSRLAPPPVVGERGAPVLLRVDAARRPASASPKRPVTRAPSRCGAQYWPSHGTDLRGAERAERRRGQPRGALEARLQAPARGRRSASRASALQRRRRRRRGRRGRSTRRRRSPCARTPSGSDASVTIAQVPRASRHTPAIAQTLQSAPAKRQ